MLSQDVSTEMPVPVPTSINSFENVRLDFEVMVIALLLPTADVSDGVNVVMRTYPAGTPLNCAAVGSPVTLVIVE
jgi:hypothetical protein